MVRFGIIGTSWITDEFIRCASLCKEFQLAAVYSRDLNRARSFAAKYGAKTCFDDLEKMAASDALDAVYIASPNSLHAAQSILFLNGKKHVLCEKPAAASEKEQRAVLDAARKNNRAYMEAMKSTLQPGMAAIKEALPKLGTLRRYTGNYCQYSSRYNAYKRGEHNNTFQLKFANGALMDLGVYVIYPMVYLFGEPERLLASCVKLDSGVDGETAVLCRYSAMDAILSFSKITASENFSEIMGEDGTLSFGAINEISQVSIRYTDTSKRAETVYKSEKEDFMYYEAREFIDIIQSGCIESSVNTFALALSVRRVMDEIRRQIQIVFPKDTGYGTDR